MGLSFLEHMQYFFGYGFVQDQIFQIDWALQNVHIFPVTAK